MKERMNAFLLEGSAEASQGSVKEVPTANLPPGELTVRVRYSGINFKDAMVAAGVG